MSRLFALLLFVGALSLSQSVVRGQDRASDLDLLKKELDLLKKEMDLLKRENELLKRENAALKKGGSPGATDGDSEAITRVTVDKVEYVYQGTTRVGTSVFVTILATSKDGIQMGPNGSMTLVDPDGEKYTGRPAQGFGVQPKLREGVPVRLIWQFGGSSPLGGALPGGPSAKITRFAGVFIQPTVGGGDNTIDFKNVPAVIAKPRPR